MAKNGPDPDMDTGLTLDIDTCPGSFPSSDKGHHPQGALIDQTFGWACPLASILETTLLLKMKHGMRWPCRDSYDFSLNAAI